MTGIVGYFGTQVVAEDGTLDRKRLSKIVFNDVEKRKRLEAFTHPAIFKAYYTRVKTISTAEPGCVILVVIPLLIELNLQHLFDRIMVVYVPPGVQIRRLALRDNITADERRP